MASGLGAIPLNLNRGNYGQALLSVAFPLAMGALAGVDSPTVGQFVNNIVNPLAGTGDLINNLGNKYLPNAYKLNPWAFKPNKANWYRQVGKDAIDDAFQTGIVRGNRENVTQEGFEKFLQSKPGDPVTAPYFSKGNTYFPNLKDKNYLIETALPDENFQKSYMWSFEKGTGPNEMGAAVLRPNPQIRGLDNFNIYKKDWLKRYKEVPKPTSKFKSEIDWAKWNPDTPKHKVLMDEYNAIEESAKKAGTWMKNPDGSSFQGTPEQFVQQQSSWFKKAFPEGYEKVYRGDMTGDRIVTGNIGNNKAIFTGDIETGKHYAGSKGNLFELIHPKSKNSIDFDNYGRSWRNISRSHFGENPPNLDILSGRLNSPQIGNYTSTDDIAGWVEKNNKDYVNIKNIFDGTDADFVKIVNHKPGNYLKSTIGNVGFFDMTNPNIYKSIVGALATGTLGKQAVEKQEFGGKVKVLDTKIENGKKYFLINK